MMPGPLEQLILDLEAGRITGFMSGSTSKPVLEAIAKTEGLTLDEVVLKIAGRCPEATTTGWGFMGLGTTTFGRLKQWVDAELLRPNRKRAEWEKACEAYTKPAAEDTCRRGEEGACAT